MRNTRDNSYHPDDQTLNLCGMRERVKVEGVGRKRVRMEGAERKRERMEGAERKRETKSKLF